MHALVFVPRGWRCHENVIVFAFDDDSHVALLQSGGHEAWMRQWMSTLRTDINSSPTDCFATFPFPPAEDQTPDLPRWLALPAFAHAARIGAAAAARTAIPAKKR